MGAAANGGRQPPSWPSGAKTIQIPVQHIPAVVDKTSAASGGGGLRSPMVLQTLKSPTDGGGSLARPIVEDSGGGGVPFPGFSKDIQSMHDAHIESMKQKFEDAKKRMNLMQQRVRSGSPIESLRTRGQDSGGGGGGVDAFDSFDAIDALSNASGDGDASSHSSYLFDQFRRKVARSKRETPLAPHPELTPQQRQHIQARSSAAAAVSAGQTGGGPLAVAGMGGGAAIVGGPMRRFNTGGSVAERVMIFERCPVFGTSGGGADGKATAGGGAGGAGSAEKKKEPNWRANLPEQTNNRLNRPVGGNISLQPPHQRIRDIPIATPVVAPLTSSALPSPPPSPPTSSIHSAPPPSSFGSTTPSSSSLIAASIEPKSAAVPVTSSTASSPRTVTSSEQPSTSSFTSSLSASLSQPSPLSSSAADRTTPSSSSSSLASSSKAQPSISSSPSIASSKVVSLASLGSSLGGGSSSSPLSSTTSSPKSSLITSQQPKSNIVTSNNSVVVNSNNSSGSPGSVQAVHLGTAPSSFTTPEQPTTTTSTTKSNDLNTDRYGSIGGSGGIGNAGGGSNNLVGSVTMRSHPNQPSSVIARSSSSYLPVAPPPPASRPTSMLITGKEKVLPKFHFPYGNPSTLNPYGDGNLEKFTAEFRRHKNASVTLNELGEILKICGYASCWKTMVFLCSGGKLNAAGAASSGTGNDNDDSNRNSSSSDVIGAGSSGLFAESGNTISLSQFSDFWRRMCSSFHDEASQFIYVVNKAAGISSASATAAANVAAAGSGGGGSNANDANLNNLGTSSSAARLNGNGVLSGGGLNNNSNSSGSNGGGGKNYVVPEDLVTLIQDVVDSHPGLGFLKEATEFHSRYVHTVIARIFYVVNRSWSGRLTVGELRRSNFLSTLRLLDEEEDINAITDFFSYEHFYVIYCKFWELDKDHDLFIDREDLSRHNDHAISTRMIDRIFSGAVTHGSAQKEGKMSYTEFVWFLLAEEDKRHPTSIEYWFRCMDLDGDGFLSMYELEYFYEEQLQRMEQLGIETLPFEDCLCQMLDMIGPKCPNLISLSDLRICPMTPIFFDTFFNLEKYLDHEQRDPFASQRDVDEDGNEMSDWDRFAAEEYELLVAEEGNADGAMDELCYEDDGDSNPEMLMEQALDNELMYQADAAGEGCEGSSGSGSMSTVGGSNPTTPSGATAAAAAAM